MKAFIEELYKLKENNSKKVAAKLAIEKLIEYTKDETIDLDRKYFVSEWSWTPIADGIYVYEEVIKDCKTYENIKVYCTGTNYRTYLPWDIYDSEDDCTLITNFKNSFGYAWEEEQSSFLRKLGARNELGKWS